MKILVANLGSTSFKYRLFDMTDERQLARGGIERIGAAERDCFVEIAGKRYSHLIDPRTGIGLTTRLQVTVIAPTAMQADSLASALSVLGPRKTSSLLKSYPKAQAYFLQGSGKNRSLLKLGKQ